MVFPEIQDLKTPRLVLRKLTVQDIPLFYTRLGSSETVTRYMLWQPHRDLSESAASVEKAIRRYDEGGFYRWAIALPEGNAIIGIIDLLRFEEESNSCSFAYMLGEDFWGRGYGTEALTAVLDFAFGQMRLDAVLADHFSVNAASGAVMRKVGMTHCATQPGKYEKNGISYDAEAYRITREEWFSYKS